jgi:hypothetical protein
MHCVFVLSETAENTHENPCRMRLRIEKMEAQMKKKENRERERSLRSFVDLRGRHSGVEWEASKQTKRNESLCVLPPKGEKATHKNNQFSSHAHSFFIPAVAHTLFVAVLCAHYAHGKRGTAPATNESEREEERQRRTANLLDYVIIASHYTLFFHMNVPHVKIKHDSC